MHYTVVRRFNATAPSSLFVFGNTSQHPQVMNHLWSLISSTVLESEGNMPEKIEDDDDRIGEYNSEDVEDSAGDAVMRSRRSTGASDSDATTFPGGKGNNYDGRTERTDMETGSSGVGEQNNYTVPQYLL